MYINSNDCHDDRPGPVDVTLREHLPKKNFFRAMAERKHSFFGEVLPYDVLINIHTDDRCSEHKFTKHSRCKQQERTAV